MQMISFVQQIFLTSGKETRKLWLRSYEIMASGPGCGIIEFLPDSLSIDYIKRKLSDRQAGTSLLHYFTTNFGPRGSKRFEVATKAFTYSLAAYSLVCYILQIKDRHNANILIDPEGHMVHIDFGFLLTNYPGGIQFEKAPFKLTSEFVEVLGGENSAGFRRFRKYFIK